MLGRAALFLAIALTFGGCAGQLPSAATSRMAPENVAAASSSAIGGAAANGAAHLRYATYAWDVSDLTTRLKAGTLWPLLESKHVDDILAGFDDAQIAQYSTHDGAATFNAFIAQAKQHGIRVELLLGDPSWILPSGRSTLTGIIHQLRAVKFDGLNLDLEPNEVTGYPMATVLADLASATTAYVKASPWPVTLDLNWIFAANANNIDDGYCLMCKLRASGLRRIDLMTYISDPAIVEATVKPILDASPKIAFAIGQSVEPPSVLPPSDSYWGDGFTRFYADMKSLDAALHPHRNYNGIVIEWLHYLETMRVS